MYLRIIIIFFASLFLSGCFNDENAKNDNSTSNSTIRKGRYIDGKYNGSIIKFDTSGDTLSIEHFKEGLLHGGSQYFDRGRLIKELIYVDGNSGVVKSFHLSGKVKRISSFVLGTNAINSFVQYDEEANLIKDNSNIFLTKKKDKLIVGFYEPYPDELNIVFKNSFDEFDSAIIEQQSYKPFNNPKIEIELKNSYYTNGRLNLVLKKVWKTSELIKSEHETKIQLDKNEVPDYNNIDPIIIN